MKRSSRLILLIGILLAIVAFVGIYLLFTQEKKPEPPTMTTVVTAAADIELGTTVTEDLITTEPVKIAEKPAGTYTTPGEVIGQIVRTKVTKGQQFTTQTFRGGAGNPTDVSQLIEPGLEAMAVQVDQVSGVGTLIKPGDRVDLVIGITGTDKFPIITIDPATNQVTPVAGINPTSVKSIVQNLQVLATLLPPPETAQQAQQQPAEGEGGTTLNGQQQIVILAVTAQQSEVVKFAQTDGTITLVLRSPKDAKVPFIETTGITLRQLVDQWNVVPPQIVETVLPKATAKP